MCSVPLKKVIKSKLKSNKELTKEERKREELKYEVAEELGLFDKVREGGWGALSAKETGKIGGIMARKKKELHMPSNSEILNSQNKK
ncbi:small, acid-soluble spore protein, alpha/beta type [Clostridium sp. BJN0001]|uniref:small, acid-soluble spore protein, alpha/beta type n=1 Tax=Clostridium sp. BJN0001 TaxID=2930219 RepID=UPI001FD1EE2E|nr:small, acid-soluble spore protein, alpha/beta type [Clostridium sp. BJN0001]